jgi:hypothetical protein
MTPFLHVSEIPSPGHFAWRENIAAILVLESYRRSDEASAKKGPGFLARALTLRRSFKLQVGRMT